MILSQRKLFKIPEEVAYLNTAYMSPLLNSVVSACDEGVRLKAQPWELKIPDFYDTVDKARTLFSKLVNVDREGVALVPSASYGIETAAKNLKVGVNRTIVLLENQFPSNVYPWQRLVREQGGKILTVKLPVESSATDAILDKINQQCAIVALPNVLWTNGRLIDLVSVRKRCDEVGAALVLDLTQSLGAISTDFSIIRPDFAVVAGYKWLLCPYSTGFLYVDPKWRNGDPLEEGWVARKGSRDFSALVNYTSNYEAGANRFDVGERANFALMPGVVKALTQIMDWGVNNIQNTLAQNNQKLALELESIGLASIPEHLRGPHFLGVKLPDSAPEDLLMRLASENVYLSERGGSLRITPHLWNNEQDFKKLKDALERHLK
jgi:selenocysteine lyase/cysteine desulfurase